MIGKDTGIEFWKGRIYFKRNDCFYKSKSFVYQLPCEDSIFCNIKDKVNEVNF